MAENVGVMLFPVRAGAVLLGVFGFMALGLAAVGLYGVIAYSVAQRTHEIGIRVALGASWGQVVGMVVRKGMLLVGVGVGFGLLASFGATRFMAGLLYGVSALDPLTFVGVPGVLCAVALLASFIPAQRAASIDPMKTLRAE